MITPIARIPALVADQPVVIIGFDATHGLCVFGNGHIEYVEHRELKVVFFRDLEVGYWFDYGGQYGETEVGSGDEVQPERAPGDAPSLSRTDGRSDDDVAESLA
jgi:hypothetical protein